jgi:hypothetical protein
MRIAMSFGFIIIRHVSSKITDYYWKECYKSIRTFYNHPILIVDDSSNPAYLHENINLVNCTVIYDKEHKGVGEFLAYYYFHLLKPFDTAIILHDSMFIQSDISFDLQDEPARLLWTIPHHFDGDIITHIHSLIHALPESDSLLQLYQDKSKWNGTFGVTMVVKWTSLDEINKRYQLFERLLPMILNRNIRCSLERVVGLLFSHHFSMPLPSYYGIIHHYIQWGITFTDYLTNDYRSYPIMKVWTGR